MAAKKRRASASKKPQKPAKKAAKRSKAGAVRKPPKSAPKKYSKGTTVYDTKAARWREGSRFVAAPTNRQVRKDRAGRPIDARGRRVPKAAVAGNQPKSRKKKTKPAIRMPDFESVAKERFRRRILPRLLVTGTPKLRLVPRVTEIAAGSSVVEKEFLSSEFSNRTSPEFAGDILANTVSGHAKKGPFEAGDIPIYNFGLKFVGDASIRSALPELSQNLPAGASMEYSETRAGDELYVRFNTKSEPLLLDQAQAYLGRPNVQAFLRQLYNSLLDYWSDIDWYVWAETDESLYE